MINYKIISDSIEYYEKENFYRIESPWIIPKYVNGITNSDQQRTFVLKNDDCLVASGEQSFLNLYLNENLNLGQFQTTTPCFRDEPIDYLHSKYFIKNELIKTNIVNNDELDKIVETCYKFYKKYIPNINIIKTNIGYDINYEDIELGSYGIRECEFLKWIYATGCAEPRLTKAIKLYNNGISY